MNNYLVQIKAQLAELQSQPMQFYNVSASVHRNGICLFYDFGPLQVHGGEWIDDVEAPYTLSEGGVTSFVAGYLGIDANSQDIQIIFDTEDDE